jgi:hypothetical protein
MMIKGLQVLDLSQNKLEELPHGVGAHEALRNLNLKDNTYSAFPYLCQVAEASQGGVKMAREAGEGRESERERDRESVCARVFPSIHSLLRASVRPSDPLSFCCKRVAGMEG